MDLQKITPQVNVLAVDDKPANLVTLEAVLGRDYTLVFAKSGAEAISILQTRHDIAVILMDLQMPEMDGYEAAARIKQIEGCQDIPIIFITAIYKEEPFIRKGYEVGGVDYFSKPFDPEILKRKVAIYAAFHQKSDILKERERQIRASEELSKVARKLSSVLENLPVGVLIADIEGRICQTNDEVSHILHGEVLSWWDSNGKLLEGSPLARALRNGEASHNQVIQLRPINGAPKSILGSVSPLRGLDGHVVGAVVLIQDVTESQRIEKDFEQRITNIISLDSATPQSVMH